MGANYCKNLASSNSKRIKFHIWWFAIKSVPRIWGWTWVHQGLITPEMRLASELKNNDQPGSLWKVRKWAWILIPFPHFYTEIREPIDHHSSRKYCYCFKLSLDKLWWIKQYLYNTNRDFKKKWRPGATNIFETFLKEKDKIDK